VTRVSASSIERRTSKEDSQSRQTYSYKAISKDTTPL
jgi:hypothetical protein